MDYAKKFDEILLWNFECWAVQKRVNLVDLVKSFQTSIYFQNSASIQPSPVYQPTNQPRTSPSKLDRWVVELDPT